MSNTDFAINRAIDSVKQAQFELSQIDLRTTRGERRDALRDARSELINVKDLLCVARSS